MADPELSQRISQISAQYQNQGISALTQAYEEFQKEVARAEAAAYKGEAGDTVLQRIRDLETLFAAVTGNDVKELSMFMKDSEALRRTAHVASVNAEHLRFGDLGGALTQKELLSAMKKYMGGESYGDESESQDAAIAASHGIGAETDAEKFNSYNWSRLLAWYYLRTKVAVPSYFLYGPLATQRRKAAPRRTVDDTGNAAKTTAQNVAAADIQEDPEQSTSHMVRTVYSVLSEHGERVNMFRFFINPDSFGQSVENLFYTSFLVRDGKIRVDVEDGVPYVEVADEEVEAEDVVLHHVATFDVASWRKLVEKHNITDLFIPHREDEPDGLDLGETEQGGRD